MRPEDLPSQELDDADRMLLELAAAEGLAKTLPSQSRDRAMLDEVIERLQGALYVMLDRGEEQESGRASGPEGRGILQEE